MDKRFYTFKTITIDRLNLENLIKICYYYNFRRKIKRNVSYQTLDFRAENRYYIEILSGEDVGRKISVAWEQMPGTAIKTSTATSANPIGGNLRVLYLDPSVEYHHRPVTRPRRAKRICKWATCLRYPATITTSSPSLPPSSTTATIEFKLSNENTAALFDPR